jgi:hypothetical protein
MHFIKEFNLGTQSDNINFLSVHLNLKLNARKSLLFRTLNLGYFMIFNIFYKKF